MSNHLYLSGGPKEVVGAEVEPLSAGARARVAHVLRRRVEARADEHQLRREGAESGQEARADTAPEGAAAHLIHTCSRDVFNF